VLGDAPSEQKHGLTAAFSETAKGALDQPARRLLPRESPDYYGGEITFKMAVDPEGQNYFTVKIWGSDKSSARLILNCEGREIGWRHGGADNEVFWDDVGGWFPERFVYRTAPLPLHLTRGKTGVSIKVRSTGPIAESDAASYEQFQKKMEQPSVGIYRAYTHLGGYLDASNEAQGSAPAPKTPRPALAEESVMNQWKADVNKKINRLLEGNAAQMSVEDLAYLAQCYGVSWSDGYKNGVLVDQVIAGIDSLVTAYGKNHENAGKRWGGSYGLAGEAIRLLYPQLQSQLDAPVNFTGPIGVTSRRQGWSAALRMSVEYGRFNRQPGASLAMIGAWNLYLANCGLLLIDPANALKEPDALRYLHEAVGLSPWQGDDQPGDFLPPVPGAAPFGPNWFTVTSKGTTKDDAFVGGLFGELGPFAMTMAIVSGDAPLRDQALKMCRARAAFRYPGTDGDGYLVMRAVQPLSCRDSRLPGPVCYLGRAFYEDFLTASLGAAAIGNDLLGYFQQQINEGQLLPLFEGGNVGDPGAPYVPDQYAAIKAMAPTGVKLPMSDSQPDFAWADEENMVLAAKHGEERFWAVLNWRNADSINGLAKIFHLTPTIAHLAEVQIDDVQFKPSGVTLSRSPQVEDVDFPGAVTPPDQPINANDGLSFPVALRADLPQAPAQNRDGGRGIGYTLRYGKWLAAINAHPNRPYTVQLPKGIAQAMDLISGQMKTGPVAVTPKTSVVFYLDTPPPAPAAAAR
jgi:hypothetical protein